MKRLITIAEARLAAAGVDPKQFSSEAELFAEAMSTSDFPLILANTLGKKVKKAYQSYPTTYEPWTTKDTTIKDFKEVSRNRFSLTGGYEVVPEGTPYPETGAAESKAAYKVKKWGKIAQVTLEMLINDDLGEINRQMNAFGKNAAETVNSFVYDQLKANPTLYDGVVLFHADHGNLGAAAALDDASLTAALVAMMKQTKENSERAARIIPKSLIVPTALLPTAQKLLADRYIPADWAEDHAEVFKGLVAVHEPEINDDEDRWYLAADPVSVETFEVGFLRGTGGTPQIFRKEGFHDDAQKYKARLVFGGAFLDFRGLYANIP